ncbi:MAG: Rpn family recombination-promoting nuclease/putative transposase [Lachnospiraceae bacterium]|nr:Rpn family recombination-promoting nuclease/putative transposase [Lachnospiraceae bacterium]
MVALIKHKSSVDYNVSMQLLRYMVFIWEDYEKDQEKLHEGISKTVEFKYPPILPIVYYEGRSEWNASKEFKNRIFLNDVFSEFVPDYRYKLIRLRDYTNRELIDRKDEISFVMLLDRLRNSNEFKKLKAELPEGYLDQISEMTADDVLTIIATVVATMLRKRNISEERIAELTEGIKNRPMGVLFEDWDSGPDEELMEKWKNIGLEEGRKEGRKEGREEERRNTEAERKNTEAERRRAEKAEAELARYKEKFGEI